MPEQIFPPMITQDIARIAREVGLIVQRNSHKMSIFFRVGKNGIAYILPKPSFENKDVSILNAVYNSLTLKPAEKHSLRPQQETFLAFIDALRAA